MGVSKWTMEDKMIFHQMRSEGATYGEIAARLGKPRDTVCKYGKRIGAAVLYGGRKQKDDTLCWSCDLANGKTDPRTCEQCSWVKNYTPVPGWYAEAVAYKSYSGSKAVETLNWRVIQCPSFIPDPVPKVI